MRCSSRCVSLLLVLVGVLTACGKTAADTIIAPPPASGTDQWEVAVPTNALPADAGGIVAIPNRGDFLLTGVDPRAGNTLWTRALPVGTNDLTGFADLFVSTKLNATDSTAYTFIDPVTGFNLWSVRLSAQQPQMVMRVGSIIVAGINDTLLVGLDRTSGREAWRTRLGPLTCSGSGGCGSFLPIGVDRGDGFILRKSTVEAQIITVRETGVVSQIVAASPTLRAVTAAEQLAAVTGTSVVAGAAGGQVVGVDPATGAERWRTTFSTVVPATYAAAPSVARFITDGTLLVALMTDGATAKELVFDMTNGSVARQRTIGANVLARVNTRCGGEGYAYLQDNGFEYVNLRTGAVASVVRPGLAATITSAGLTNVLATTTGYIVFSLDGSRPGRIIGVRCTPS